MASAATPAPKSTPSHNKALVWIFFDEVFNKGQFDVVSKLGPNYKFNGQPQNNADFIGWVKSLRSTYPNINVTFVSSVAEDDTVAIRWHMTGSHDQADGCWTVDAYGNNVFTFSPAGDILTNDQAGSCTRVQDGTTTTLGSEAILAPLSATWKPAA